MPKLAQDYQNFLEQLTNYMRSLKRSPDSITVLVVSKTQSTEKIAELYKVGVREFGENYLQEALPKIKALSHLNNLNWHYIGTLQGNKCQAIAHNFTWVHSISSAKHAKLLNKYCQEINKHLNICINVNIDEEESKSGIILTQLPDFIKEISSCQFLRIRGLMALPKPSLDFSSQAISFNKLNEAFIELNASGYNLDTLSIGTSNDYQAAIANGATIIRIGTSIFGPRLKK